MHVFTIDTYYYILTQIGVQSQIFENTKKLKCIYIISTPVRKLKIRNRLN